MRAPFPSKEASWQRLQLKIEAKEKQSARQSSGFSVFAAAASIALIVGVLFFMNSSDLRVETQFAEQKTCLLPDGSEVTLNAGSYIQYDEDDFLESRVLTLDGEAFFKVKKGSTFKVLTDQGEVQVLGTSFNVFDRADLFEVVCATGKVQVSVGANSVILEPGQATERKQESLSAVYERTNSNAWTKGTFDFADRSIEHVFDEVERQFGVTITLDDIGERFYTGEFNSSDLETALVVICEPMGLNYELTDTMDIVVTNK